MSSSLSVYHQQKLTQFLRLFHTRIEKHLLNIDAEFEDIRSDRLSSDDVYDQKDVHSALTSLAFAIKSTVGSELQDIIHMTAILLGQALQAAENHEIEIELDLAAAEDRDLMDKIARSNAIDWSSSKKGKAIVASPSGVSSAEEQVNTLQMQLKAKQEMIENLECQLKETQTHFSQSRQFLDMKQVVAKKNEQLRLLRERLQQYEDKGATLSE